MRYASTWARCSLSNGKPLKAKRLPRQMRLLDQTFNQGHYLLPAAQWARPRKGPGRARGPAA